VHSPCHGHGVRVVFILVIVVTVTKINTTRTPVVTPPNFESRRRRKSIIMITGAQTIMMMGTVNGDNESKYTIYTPHSFGRRVTVSSFQHLHLQTHPSW
jgi:hypothetical protein